MTSKGPFQPKAFMDVLSMELGKPLQSSGSLFFVNVINSSCTQSLVES